MNKYYIAISLLTLFCSCAHNKKPTIVVDERGKINVINVEDSTLRNCCEAILFSSFVEADTWPEACLSADRDEILLFIVRLFSDTAFSAPLKNRYGEIYFYDYLPYVLKTCPIEDMRKEAIERLMDKDNTLWFLACWNSDEYLDSFTYSAFVDRIAERGNLLRLIDLFAMAHNNKATTEKNRLRAILSEQNIFLLPDSALPVQLDYPYELGEVTTTYTQEKGQ